MTLISNNLNEFCLIILDQTTQHRYGKWVLPFKQQNAKHSQIWDVILSHPKKHSIFLSIQKSSSIFLSIQKYWAIFENTEHHINNAFRDIFPSFPHHATTPGLKRSRNTLGLLPFPAEPAWTIFMLKLLLPLYQKGNGPVSPPARTVGDFRVWKR